MLSIEFSEISLIAAGYNTCAWSLLSPAMKPTVKTILALSPLVPKFLRFLLSSDLNNPLAATV